LNGFLTVLDPSFVPEAAHVIRSLTRRGVYATPLALALALTPIGCGNGRPPGIANQPGDSFVELTDLVGDRKDAEQQLCMRVHYRFPDGLPHPDAWFRFYFEVNGGNSGVVSIRKQGRELQEEGDIDASTSTSFIRKSAIGCAAFVQQAAKKEGPWHNVSDKLVSE
jgi:hypothetical protein